MGPAPNAVLGGPQLADSEPRKGGRDHSDPDTGEKPLAAPFIVIFGASDIADRFPVTSIEDVQERARRVAAEQNAVPVDPDAIPYGELIDWKMSEFKRAVRRAPRP